MPNTKNSSRVVEELLFRCDCGGNHFLEVYYDKEDGDSDNNFIGDDLWFCWIDYPNSLLQAIKWWWKQRKVWHSETSLNKKDVEELVKHLNRYLKLKNKKV